MPVTVEQQTIHWPSAVFESSWRRIPYAMRTSARARHMSLWMSPAAGLVVVVPARTGGGWAGGLWKREVKPSDIDAFVHRYRRWVTAYYERMVRCHGEPARRWPYGPETLLQGEAHAVDLGTNGRAEVNVKQMPQRELMILTRTPGIEAAQQVFTRWRIAQAQRTLSERAAALGALMGTSWRNLSVGTARSRWGSCSAAGSLRFTFRLIMAPPPIQDYVVVHELAHRTHFDHSPAFWRHVEAACPAHREARAWLRRVGPTLA